jgi:hypothetical protein
MDTQRLSTALNDPRYDQRFKMPGYTGHVNGLMEVYASTPVHASVRHPIHPSQHRTLPLDPQQAHPLWGCIPIKLGSEGASRQRTMLKYPVYTSSWV